MISGMLTPGPEAEFAYPSSLKPELFAAIGDYVPDIDLPKYEAESHQDALSFMNVVSHAFLQREKAFFYLMDHKPWDFFMGVFILADRLQHFFWKYMDPDCGLYGSAMANRLRGNITDCYRLMDDFLGRLLDRLTPDTLLLIMSDHGFGPTDAWFNVSAWLEAQGLLRMRKEVASRKKLLYKLVSLNDVKWVRSLVPGFIQSRMRKRARRGRSAFVTDLHETLDWDRTRAFFPSIPSQGIYINVRREGFGVVPPGDAYEALRREIKGRLEDLRDEKTGERLVGWVKFREEGPGEGGGESSWFRELRPDEREGARGRGMNGTHRPEGFFVFSGPGVRPDRYEPGADLADFAPTLMAHLGERPATPMEGRVLSALLDAPGPSSDPPPVRNADLTSVTMGAGGPDWESETAKRLRDLGYLE